MEEIKMDPNIILDLRKLKAIADYQFGPSITDILFNNLNRIELRKSKNTGKIRYIYEEDKLLLNLRPNNGLFTLSFLSAEKIIKNTKSPRLRVVVLSEISEYIRNGRNVFCKHVVNLDGMLRPLDEIIVVNQEDELLALGRLKLPPSHVISFNQGIAINVRKGLNSN